MPMVRIQPGLTALIPLSRWGQCPHAVHLFGLLSPPRSTLEGIWTVFVEHVHCLTAS